MNTETGVSSVGGDGAFYFLTLEGDDIIPDYRKVINAVPLTLYLTKSGS